MRRALLIVALVLSILVPNSIGITPLPYNVTNAMASREIRYHHFVWHNVRNLWNSLSASTQAQIASYGWTPPRPAKDKNGNSLPNNDSGQDFLYFHRKMIANVQYLMNQSGKGNISLWNVIPTPTNSTYPLSPVYTGPSAQLTKLIKYYKSSSYYTYLKNQEKKLTDPKYLRSVTLGQLGSYIEFASDVHQGLHFRFSSYNRMMRVKSNVVFPYIDAKWDVNTSDWLADIYCSQVNPWFWKIHGWIDNRINDWARANNVSNITWNGTWLGGNMSSLPKNLNIPNDPNDRFLGEAHSHDMSGMDMGNDTQSSTNSSTNSTSDMDMGMNMSQGMDMSHGMGNMDIKSLEAVAKILIETGMSCDYFNELDSNEAHEDDTEVDHPARGSCEDDKKN